MEITQSVDRKTKVMDMSCAGGKYMTELLKRLWSGSEGQNLSEYALLLALVSLLAVAGMRGLASSVDHVYSKTSTHVIAAGRMESITTDSMRDADSNQIAPTATTRSTGLAPSDHALIGLRH